MFPAEHFAEVYAKDSSKRKQFQGHHADCRGRSHPGFSCARFRVELYIIGVAEHLTGVLEYRLKSEYNVEIRIRTSFLHGALG
jgi:peptide chain release factor 3